MKNSYHVKKGVPLPPDGRGRVRKYPWDKMEIGDSFFIPKGERTIVTISSPPRLLKLGWKFTTRQVVEDEGPGLRVWRVE